MLDRHNWYHRDNARSVEVGDTSGEWFEVYNAGDETLDLKGAKIVSASGLNNSESHTIATSVIVEPGEYAVIGNNANTATNGGVFEAYSYGGSISLNNGSSTSANEWLAIRKLTVTPAGTDSVTFDSVAYAVRPPVVPPAAFAPAPGPYTPPSGASRALLDLTADNFLISGTAWATSVTPFGAGDRGTPGQPNVGGPAASVTVRISWVTPGTRQGHCTCGLSQRKTSARMSHGRDPTRATIDPGVASWAFRRSRTLTADAANGRSGNSALLGGSWDVASISAQRQQPAQYRRITKPAFRLQKHHQRRITQTLQVKSESDRYVSAPATYRCCHGKS